MNVLFIHQNFPAQFKALAEKIADDNAHKVSVIHLNTIQNPHPNIEYFNYSITRKSSQDIHPWLIDLETKVIRGHEVLRLMHALKDKGFQPDVVIAHPGWGESLYVKDVWPECKLIIYAEFFYRVDGADLNYDPEFARHDTLIASKIRSKNAFYSMQFPTVDAIISPTQWQKSTFPKAIQPLIDVHHEGIDTDYFSPNADVCLELNRHGKKLRLTCQDEIITFVSRNLEPYRGYHSFMRALPGIMKARPNSKVLIIGGEGCSYGQPPRGEQLKKGRNWKEIFLNEVKDSIDMERVFYLDFIAYEEYRAALRISTVHVYLTYPFVLSWSLLEAMSMSCAIVANDVEAVKEVMSDNHNGRLVNFFDINQIQEAVVDLLTNDKKRKQISKQSRKFAVENYDQKTVCLPGLMEWLSPMMSNKPKKDDIRLSKQD